MSKHHTSSSSSISKLLTELRHWMDGQEQQHWSVGSSSSSSSSSRSGNSSRGRDITCRLVSGMGSSSKEEALQQ